MVETTVDVSERRHEWQFRSDSTPSSLALFILRRSWFNTRVGAASRKKVVGSIPGLVSVRSLHVGSMKIIISWILCFFSCIIHSHGSLPHLFILECSAPYGLHSQAGLLQPKAQNVLDAEQIRRTGSTARSSWGLCVPHFPPFCSSSLIGPHAGLVCHYIDTPTALWGPASKTGTTQQGTYHLPCKVSLFLVVIEATNYC